MMFETFITSSPKHNPSMAESKQQIAIVGGGISGVVLALALLRRGLHVQLYEQAHAFGK